MGFDDFLTNLRLKSLLITLRNYIFNRSQLYIIFLVNFTIRLDKIYYSRECVLLKSLYTVFSVTPRFLM